MIFSEQTRLLKRYADAQISALDLRRSMGDIGYGDVIIALAQRNLSLPRASQAGRETRIALARELLFPRDA